MHRDVVHAVPGAFRKLGSSPRCNVQNLYLPGRVLAVQAHPEFDKFIMEKLLNKRHDDGIFDKAMYSDGMRRTTAAHDGILVASVMLKFLFGEL